ncbi:hypothetical protein ACA910_002436 [Epithemia clementina (nom. ined.)]
MTSKAKGTAECIEIVDDDEEEEIDEEQLQEYSEMVENLGEFPDKVKISSLSMVSEDYSDSMTASKKLYKIIRERIMRSSRERLLPLVYLIDSILKNAKGHFIKIVENDAENWLPLVFQKLSENQKHKLQKVWKTWGDTNLFEAAKLKVMGRCFDRSSNSSIKQTISTEVAGITRTSDGSLILRKALREEMQNILDDMQSDVNEVDKISLERLAQINPSLLAKVKKTALEGLESGGQQNSQGFGHGRPRNSGSSADDDTTSLPSFLTETRPPEQIQRAKAWVEIASKTQEAAPGVVDDLLSQVRTCGETQCTRPDAISMTQYLASASATASLLSATLERIKNELDQKKNALLLAAGAASLQAGILPIMQIQVVDPSQFTNEGVKKKNDSVISMLYEVGLPFVSSADGRRFRSQLELSKHLDSLFKRSQLEKSIAKTEERGWYELDLVWAGLSKQNDMDRLPDDSIGKSKQDDTQFQGDGYSPETSTVPADEVRDRCVVCGINFKMFFDNDDGQYKYNNCREIELMNDEIALNDSEQSLVHVTCWRGLGSPDVLTMDQALQEALHF